MQLENLSDHTFAAVVLCGGQSRRMGTDKAFLTYQGKPLYEHQLNFLRRFGPGQVMLSGRRGVAYPGVPEIVVDAPDSSGPVAGLSAALENCRHPHLLVLAVDMPKASSALIEALLARRKPGCGVIPFIGENPEPLIALYPKEALSLIHEQLRKNRLRARDFAHACEHSGLTQRFICAEAEQPHFENWNQPGDLKRPECRKK